MHSLLLVVATVGNTLGGMTGWLIGRAIPAGGLDRPEGRRAVEQVRRWGSPVLLLSWMPVVGDPLCLAAGWLRCAWPAALAYILTGKGVRYAVILWLV